MNNQREIYEALLAGETLISKNESYMVKLSDVGNLVNELGQGVVHRFIRGYEWQIYKEPKWYENIPDGGVLCFHYDRIIMVDNGGWNEIEDVVPLTKAEIQVFMDNANE